MAWRSSGRTNQELVDNLWANGLMKNERVRAAMLAVDRANFVLYPSHAYEDSPQAIGKGQTISAPHMHANAADNLQEFVKPGANILDVGCGSGYLAAVLAHMVSIAIIAICFFLIYYVVLKGGYIVLTIL